MSVFESVLTKGRRIVAVLVALIVAMVLLFPGKPQVIETSSTLQAGKKIDVRLVLGKSWPWTQPDTLKVFTVRLDGKELSLPRQAWKGLHPLDSAKGAVIVERQGFPEILMWGRPGSVLSQAIFRFQNDSFSERRLVRSGRVETAYYPSASPALVVSSPAPQESKPLVVPNAEIHRLPETETHSGVPLTPPVSLSDPTVHKIASSEHKK